MSNLDRLDFGTVIRAQNHLYERALHRADESRLSGRALAYDPASDRGFAFDPAFPVYPDALAPRVAALPREEAALLTRLLFAFEKENVAQNEMLTLTWNTRCAIRAFGLFSDEYWVQHRETMDEYDHIYGFQTLARKLLGRGLVASELERKNRFRDLTFSTLEPLLHTPQAVPALYFTLRFMANVFLKMVEGFSFDPRRAELGYSHALERINQAHHDDEARHFTSSWAFGRQLYLAIPDEKERELVRAVLALYIALHLRTLVVGGHLVRTGFEALRFALEQGSLPSLRVSPEELAHAYASHSCLVDLGPSRRRESFRWAASQFRKLELALELTPADFSPRGLHPENQALLERLREEVLASSGDSEDDLALEPCYRAYRALLGES